MMTPHINIDKSRWHDSISSLDFDIWSPESVNNAICSGAIGIGSFIAPLLHHFPNVHIRHLCSSQNTTIRPNSQMVLPVLIAEEFLDTGLLCPALKIVQRTGSSNARGLENGHPYQVTDDLPNWLDDLPDGPILLHIDMDYFNNRFNGDSDWMERGSKYNPSLKSVLNRIDQIFEAIKRFGLDERIVDIAVALSPGFFPVELWAPTIERIKNHISYFTNVNALLPIE